MKNTYILMRYNNETLDEEILEEILIEEKELESVKKKAELYTIKFPDETIILHKEGKNGELEEIYSVNNSDIQSNKC